MASPRAGMPSLDRLDPVIRGYGGGGLRTAFGKLSGKLAERQDRAQSSPARYGARIVSPAQQMNARCKLRYVHIHLRPPIYVSSRHGATFITETSSRPPPRSELMKSL